MGGQSISRRSFLQATSAGAGALALGKAYLTALKSNGGQGLLYWEPEVCSPFTGYSMGAWAPPTREPAAIMNGFTAV
jgi:hypothetical protein